MLTIWELSSAKKEVSSVSLEKWHVGKTLSWVDCFQPTDKELHQISQKTKIPFADLKTSIDPNKRPHVISFNSHSLIIFRGLYQKKGKFHTAPVGIFLFKNDIITLHDQPILGLENLRKLPKKSLLEIFKRGAPYFVEMFMNSVINDFFSFIEEIEDDVGKLEDEVVHKPGEMFTKRIFIQKRKLIYTHKSLVANREVIAAIEKEYLREFKDEDLRMLRDLYNAIAQLIDLVSTYRDMLTSILDMYLSSVSNNLNQIIKTLTVISAFVLVPTLIASIYGMNFQKIGPWSMPELYWEHGYLFSLALMLVSVIITYFFVKKKGWL